MAAPYLASDVMDEAAGVFLNDAAKSTFTYVAMLPHLKKANEFLQNLLIACGVEVQRQTSAVITLAATTYSDVSTPIDLSASIGYPSDMLLPINLRERDGGSLSQTFIPMYERDWEPDLKPVSSLTYWAFRNNKIYVPQVTSSRNILINYWRELTSITSANSNEEVAGAKNYLSAKTAELCARYIGQNTEIADALLVNEVGPAQDLLERIYIKNTQGSGRARRKRFTRPRVSYSR